MTKHFSHWLGWLGVAAVLVGVSAFVEAQAPPPSASRPAYTPPRTPWGDPDIQGAFTNSDESQTPMERPKELEGRRLEDITPEELTKLNEQRNQARTRADEIRWELRSPLHWFENLNFRNSRAWMVTDPPDGRIPPLTPQARPRAAARAEARKGRGEADSYEDRSLFDRCISRGIPGSMMPAIYGNSYDITQGPGYVGIRYEMINEARIIPLSTGPHVGSTIKSYMGDARGHFEGNTLVVETTNMLDRIAYRGASARLKLVERFTPVAPGVLEWAITLDDPDTWTRPWTFAMHLKQVAASESPFEYACHEGNYAMFNLLSIARAEEAQAAKAGAATPGR
ncbi:MAG TPA: hypothetical protein VIY56_12960 [Vicinamibacterales bacterium]